MKMEIEDVILGGAVALAGYYLVSGGSKPQGSMIESLRSRFGAFRHGGDFVPAVPSLPQFIPIIQESAERTPQIISLSMPTGTGEILKRPPLNVPSISDVGNITKVPEKVSENLAKTTENIKQTTTSALDKGVKIAKYTAGGYVAGKGLQLVTKAIPERRIERRIITKGIEKVAEKRALGTALKVVKVGGALTTGAMIGATIGKAIGEATKHTRVAHEVAKRIVEHETLTKVITTIGRIGNLFSLI